MSGGRRFGLRLSDLVTGVRMDRELVTELATVAHVQAHIASSALHDVVLPSLPASQRMLPASLARRLERYEFLDDGFLRDLESFLHALERQVAAGTHLEWEADEHHVRGGYETVARDPDVEALAGALRELELLQDTVLATLSGTRALNAASMLDG